MALAKNDLKTEYPLPVYNYKVEIAGVAIGFSEVSGLSLSVETTTYKESRTESGISGPRTMRMPAQPTDVTVTLKKGLVLGTSLGNLYNWLNQIQINQVEKKDIVVQLSDEKGDAVITWKVINAFPTKLDAPTFDATSNDVAIESLELLADAIIIEEV